MDVEQMSDPKRHPWKTNGFPVETCLTCGWPEDAHTERNVIGELSHQPKERNDHHTRH
jgi:hypothetical protein